MMRSSLLAIPLALGLVFPVSAAPQDDKAFILAHFLDEDAKMNIRTHLAEAHARHYARRLQQKSVKVVDTERFASLLPEPFNDPSLAIAVQRVSDRCFARFSPAELSEGVSRIKMNPAGAIDTPEELKSIEQRIALVFGICYVGQVGMLGAEIVRGETRKSPEANQMIAEILAVPGVAVFPNRVLRDSILRDIRAGNY